MSKDTRRTFGIGMEFDNVRIRYAELADYLAEIMPEAGKTRNGIGHGVFNHLELSCRDAIEFMSRQPVVMADEDGQGCPDCEPDETELRVNEEATAWDAAEVPTENPGL